MQQQTVTDELIQCIRENRLTIPMIQSFLDRGASLTELNEDNDNVMHVAALHGADQSLKNLTQYLIATVETYTEENRDFWTLLGNAFAHFEHNVPFPVLSMLSAKNKKGFTPLHKAASGGHEDCVRFLLSKKLTVNCEDKMRRTPLGLAARNGHLSTVNLLKSRGGILHYRDEVRLQPIHLTALGGSVPTMRFMLEQGIPYDVCDGHGAMPSCFAAANGKMEMLILLQQEGDKFNGKQRHHDAFFHQGLEAPLKYSAMTGHHDVMKFLIACDVDIEQPDRKGLPPIYHAAKSNQTGSIDTLVSFGADFQSLTRSGQLPIDLATDLTWKLGFFQRFGMCIDRDAYTYACLCYMSSYNDPNDRISLTGKPEEAIFQAAEQYLASEGWIRYTDCHELSANHANLQLAINEHHYYGIIYYREVNQEIKFVIAHRGTDLFSKANLVADGQIMAREIPRLFYDATLPFIDHFLTQINTAQGMFFGSKRVKSLTHVGFSLGGFLAAAATIFRDSPITFAKTFDAPGADFMVTSPQHRLALSQRIVNYVGIPNMVNACNHHIGPVYQISCVPIKDSQQQQHDEHFEVPSLSLLTHLLNTAKRHDLRNIIESNFKRQGLFLRAVTLWPQANIELVYGPYPVSVARSNSLYDVTHSFLKELLAPQLWHAMKRYNQSGQLEGLICVRHSCDYSVDYLLNGNEEMLNGLNLC